MFVDHCFLFFQVDVNEANVLKNVLATYEEVSGQAINFQKLETFCRRNVSNNVKGKVANILGVQQALLVITHIMSDAK